MAQVQRNGTERRHRTREYLEFKGTHKESAVEHHRAAQMQTTRAEAKNSPGVVWALGWVMVYLATGALSAAMDF